MTPFGIVIGLNVLSLVVAGFITVEYARINRERDQFFRQIGSKTAYRRWSVTMIIALYLGLTVAIALASSIAFTAWLA